MFKQLVDTQFPTLASHLDMHGVNVASVSTQWFLCLFVNSLPLETCLRVWDVFFLEQCASTLFRIALTLVDIYSLVRLPNLYSQRCVNEPACSWNDGPPIWEILQATPTELHCIHCVACSPDSI